MAGRLFLVATPIGNLGDLTQRAVETLRAVAVIACEDTRRTRLLVDRYEITTPLVSLPAFSEKARAAGFLDRLVGGDDGALVTDAGSPAISDPGEYLVAEALARGVEVVPIPGPSALIAALSGSGLSTARFHFLGFLPRQASDAASMLEEVAGLRATLVLYESPQRLGSTLAVLATALGDQRRACVARELTKVHEEWVRGTLAELGQRFQGREVLGEVVVVVEGRTSESRWTDAEVKAAVEAELGRGERLKTLSSAIAKRAGWSSQQVYRLAVGLRPATKE